MSIEPGVISRKHYPGAWEKMSLGKEIVTIFKSKYSVHAILHGVSSVVNRSQILEYMDATYAYRRKRIKNLSLNTFDTINKEWPRLADFNQGQLVSIISCRFTYYPANCTDRNDARIFLIFSVGSPSSARWRISFLSTTPNSLNMPKPLELLGRIYCTEICRRSKT